MKFKQLLTVLLSIISFNAVADAPFTISVNGLEVTDAKTGLIWRRCPEGMTASISGCMGTATTFAHLQALEHASTQSGGSWRLPNVQELSSIIDLGRQNPAIDPAAFPATPIIEFWSSSPVAASIGSAWFVRFEFGLVGNGDRFSQLHVRLVRAGQ